MFIFKKYHKIKGLNMFNKEKKSIFKSFTSKKIGSLLLAFTFALTGLHGVTNVLGNDLSNSSQTKETSFEQLLGEDDGTIKFKDLQGEEISIKKKPKRVICAYNSYLDLWYKSGGSVVGKIEDSKDKVVPGAKDAAIIGSASNPSLELILNLEPDLVILSPSFKAHKELAKNLKEQKIDYIMVEANSLKDYLFVCYLFTAINDKKDLYKNLGEDILSQVNDVKDRVPKDKNYKAAIIFASPKALNLRTSNTMLGEMVKDMNLINIADVFKDKETVNFSMEELIKEDPDFIFVQIMGTDEKAVKEVLEKEAESNEAFKELKAVKNKRYLILPKDLYLYKPNDRYGEAYLKLGQMIYPEVFGQYKGE